MINFFYNLSPLFQAIIASLLTFSMTILGASTVFLFKKINNKILNVMISLSAGTMLSAAIFSLLLPSIEQATTLKLNAPLIVSLSILLGSLLLIVGDHLTKYIKNDKYSKTNIFLLLTSIVLHNIPEGMAIGVAFASTIYNLDGVTITTAISLAVGIGIQNFPEGAAIALPLRNLGLSRKKSFIIGSLTGIVEPVSAVIGVLLVLKIKILLPYLLAFASGAMIFVVVEELIPEAVNNKNKIMMSYIVLIGFVFMMLLEIGI